MTSAIEQINEDVVHRVPEPHSEELLTANELVVLPPKRLPFSYARRAGVLLSKNNEHPVV